MSNNNNEILIELPPLKPWQKDVYKSVIDPKNKGKRTVVVSKRQVGKSILAECLLITYALQSKTTNLIIEPALHQSRRVFREILDMLNGSGAIKSANASLLQMEMVNGSIIYFQSAEQKDTLRGISINGILIVDEGAFIADDVYNILFPMVDASNAPMLILSTPLFRSGMFYDLYTNPYSITFDWSTYDTSCFLPNEKLEEYRKTLPPLRYQSEYLGHFIDEKGLLFTNLSECIQKEKVDSKPIFGGIDFGTGNNGDYTVCTFIDDFNNIVDCIYFNNIAPMQQVDILAREINERGTLHKVLAERNSIGNVYLDALYKKLNRPSILKPFDTTNESKRRIIENLSKAFDTLDISIPNDKVLIDQLQYYQVERTPSGKITYNGMQGHNDDAVISLALALEAKRNNSSKYVLSF